MDNKEKIAKVKKQYNINHKEEIKKYNKQYRLDNYEKINGLQRQCRQEKQEWLNNYKLFKGCAVCGYKKFPQALDFHHPNDDKEFGIAKGVQQHRDLEDIKKEVRKCIILCKNCHTELHIKNNKMKGGE